MRVLLINPPFISTGMIKGHGGNLIPLNLCYLAAYAREKHPSMDFRILDSCALGYDVTESATAAADSTPDVIGITANTCVFDHVIQLCARLKGLLPSARIVIGGSHPTVLPERSLRETKADFAAIGEGEVTFSELLAALARNQNDLSSIDGLAYFNKQDRFRLNRPRGLISDLDTVPFPARDLVDNSLYVPAPTKRVALGINTLICTSRGCPHNCGFCSAQAIWTRKIRKRTASSVVGEIRECIEKHSVTNFNISDEYFTADKERVREICRLMRRDNCVIPWVCMSRAERLDSGILGEMKDAGCREISFGIESGDPQTLARIGKRLDRQEVIRTVRATQRAGIKTHASYILGYLGESVESMQRTIRFAQKLNTDVAAFFVASPFPGSPLYDEARERGYIRADAAWEDFSPLSNNRSVMEMPNLSIDTIRYWHRKAVRSYYLRPRYIVTRLLRVRHWYEIANMVGGLRVFFSIQK